MVYNYAKVHKHVKYQLSTAMFSQFVRHLGWSVTGKIINFPREIFWNFGGGGDPKHGLFLESPEISLDHGLLRCSPTY